MKIQSEAFLKAILENINVAIWAAERINGEIKVLLYSPAIKTITGYSEEAFLKNPRLWFDIIHPSESSEIIGKLNSFYHDKNEQSLNLEYRILNNEGSTVWIQNKIKVIRNEWGEVTNIYGVVNDITENKKTELEIGASAEKLQKLNEIKDRFISIVSHDMRTPFNSILGFVDMLLEDRALPEEEQITYLNFIKDSSNNMYSLVNSLLDWTRLQTGRIKFDPETINANAYVRRSKEMMSGVALQKNIEIATNLMPDIFIYADENLILQVFNNIISNAIKFTKPGGKVSISAESLNDVRMAKFCIEDSGVGIKEENIHKLFEVDKKLSTVGTQGEKGSGLGLTLCHEIVTKHGGKIWAESEWEKGTKICFTIPVASEQILLVDDINTDRILYAKLLKSIIPDHEVLEAHNGSEALEIIQHISPALVITDHKMPVMSGVELISQLKNLNIKYKPPVIILSSHLDSNIISEYHKMGVEYVFEKPVNLNTFKKAIDRSIEQSINGYH
jgi:PAS domain S-box-containing protein